MRLVGLSTQLDTERRAFLQRSDVTTLDYNRVAAPLGLRVFGVAGIAVVGVNGDAGQVLAKKLFPEAIIASFTTFAGNDLPTFHARLP